MRFRRVLQLLALTVLGVGVVHADDFCNGYKEGYKTGYKQAAKTNLDPLPPLCPIKPLKGFGDPKSDTEFGYTHGFKKGTAEGAKRSSR